MVKIFQNYLEKEFPLKSKVLQTTFDNIISGLLGQLAILNNFDFLKKYFS